MSLTGWWLSYTPGGFGTNGIQTSLSERYVRQKKTILVLWLKIQFRFFFLSMSTKPHRSFRFTISTSHSRSMVSGSLSHSCYSYWKWLGKQLFKKQINNTSEKRGRYLLCLLNNKLVPIPREFFEWIWHSRYYQWSRTENRKKKINNPPERSSGGFKRKRPKSWQWK